MINPLRWAMLRLRATFLRRTIDDDMQAEMREHLARTTERLRARGMSERDAQLAARKEFGNLTVLQEEGRDARGARWVDEIAGDARFAFRYFSRHKATTVIIVVVLALGTGANTMIFSLFQSEFVRPAPAMPDDDALARIWVQERATRSAQWQPRGFSFRELVALADRRDIFRDVGAWLADQVVLGDDTVAVRGVNAQYVTPNYFRALGVPLVAGQGFAQASSAAPDMNAVMSFAMAEQLFGTAASAVGRRVRVNEVPVYIAGVAPPRFQGAVRHMDEPALWIPLSARADIAHVSPRWLTDSASLSPFARLAPNVSREQASLFVRRVVASTLPDSAARVGMARTASVLTMAAPSPGAASEEMLLAVTLIMTVGALILFVAWTNVSSLMVAAAVARRHEIAVRLSLGASRIRILRQLVTESTLLALTGSAVGLTLAWWVLAYQTKTEIDAVDVMPDAGTCTFVVVMALMTGILFGLSPALHATRSGVANALRDSGTATGGRSRLQRGFVVAQIALSQPLLVLLGTMLWLIVADYQPLSPEMSRRVITVRFRPMKTGVSGQRAEAVDALVPRIAERPEVLNAVPEPDGFAIRGVVTPERTRRLPSDTVPTIVHMEGAAPGWFHIVDIPILLGRDVSLGDTAALDHPVVIGSDLARALWGAANPIGGALVSPPLPGWKQDSMTMTVVGVYDASQRLPGMSWGGSAVGGSKPLRVFTADGKQWRHDAILVRTRGAAAPFLSELQRFVRAEAPALPVTSMQTFQQEDERNYTDTLRSASMACAAGVLALLLASLGLYGVIALAVRQRTREIGIRIAVGAHPMRVARMFLTSGVRASLLALALGLPLSIAALKIGISQGLVIAPDVNPYLVGAAIALILLAVASAATWLPARRAALVDPARTLRVE